jgi:DNA-binding beta-propeller fold protein YncE
MNNTKIQMLPILLLTLIIIGVAAASGPDNSSFEPMDQDPVRSPGEGYALIIGISNYQDPSFPQLGGPAYDVQHMEEMLINDCGYSSSRIVTLKDSQATKNAIHSAITQMSSRLGTEDTFVFHFSGHGYGLDNGQSTLVPYDADPSYYYNDILSSDLKQWLDTIKCKNVLVIIDACHAEGMIRDGRSVNYTDSQSSFRVTEQSDADLFSQNFIGAFSTANNDGQNVSDQQKGLTGNQYVVLAACRYYESSWEAVHSGGYFTSYIVEGIGKSSTDTNMDLWVSGEEAFNYASPLTTIKQNDQHPVMYDGDPVHDLKMAYYGAFGSIGVSSSPSGSKVYLDGSDTGLVTPATILNVPVGSHVITCHMDGYDDSSLEVNILEGQTISVQLQLKEADYKYMSTLGQFGSANGQFNKPFGIAVDGQRNRIYVADTWNSRVQVFDKSGHFIRNLPGQFSYPFDVAVDNVLGNVYTVEQTGNRVQVFSLDGTFLRTWGSAGTGNGQFDWSDGIAVDAVRDRVYVTDTRNNRVQAFDRNGNFILKFGTYGSGNGQFKTPYGIAVNPINGNIYVCDPGNSRVQVFNSLGTYLNQFGTRGSGESQFLDPMGVEIDKEGNVFVAETNNGRIQVFSAAGTYIGRWGTSGTGNGQFNLPYAVSIDDTNGYAFVADTHNSRVQVFSPLIQQPATGSIFIQSSPTGAKIYLDGVDTGYIAPGTLTTITPGHHVIRCNLSGYTDNSSMVSVIAGQTASATINLVNNPTTGSVSIQSIPVGAKIYLDNVDTGFITPKTIFSLAAGNHEIRCSLSGYHDESRPVVVVSGQVTNVSFNLVTIGNGNASITLQKGWNFVSVPKKLASGYNTATIFSQVNMGGHSAYMWDGAQSPGRWNTLQADTPIQPLYGVWIYSESSHTVDLQFENNQMTAPPQRSLPAGWNTIGFTGLTPASARNTYLGVQSGWVNSMGFDALTQRYEPTMFNGDISESTLLYPMKGYWLYMRDPGTLPAIGV